LSEGAGPNVTSITSTWPGTTTTVNTGPGKNVVAIGGPVSGLPDVAGPLAVNGGGPLALVFNDQANLRNTAYTLTASTVSRPGWAFTFAGAQSVVFNGGSGRDLYLVFSTAAGTATSINVGGSGKSDAVVGNATAGLNNI